jgi:hypothetical protein
VNTVNTKTTSVRFANTPHMQERELETLVDRKKLGTPAGTLTTAPTDMQRLGITIGVGLQTNMNYVVTLIDVPEGGREVAYTRQLGTYATKGDLETALPILVAGVNAIPPLCHARTVHRSVMITERTSAPPLAPELREASATWDFLSPKV